MEVKRKQRIALSVYFFLAGFCFSTWASRIPSIKAAFDFNEAELGNLLLAMPLSSLIGLPVSGLLVSRFNSRGPLVLATVCLSFALMSIGFAEDLFLLVTAICSFSFSMRILNIAMNTQAIRLQKSYGKKINGSFHGLWSTGGLTGVGFSTLMLKLNIGMPQHLLIVSIFSGIAAVSAYRFLLKNDKAPAGNRLKFGKPDKFILYLGLLVFFAALCEGGMFDWSGVYFKEVIGEEIFTLGYFIFMIFMATSRFFSDKLIEQIGMKKTYLISSIFIASGIATVIIFPFFWPALLGFSLVGMGVAAIMPMTFTLAGTSSKYSTGMAVSIVTTYSITGMLLGPPMIGYLANAFGLKLAFILFMVSGLLLIPVSRLFFRTHGSAEIAE